jgi:hypothetical protein
VLVAQAAAAERAGDVAGAMALFERAAAVADGEGSGAGLPRDKLLLLEPLAAPIREKVRGWRRRGDGEGEEKASCRSEGAAEGIEATLPPTLPPARTPRHCQPPPRIREALADARQVRNMKGSSLTALQRLFPPQVRNMKGSTEAARRALVGADMAQRSAQQRAEQPEMVDGIEVGRRGAGAAQL